MGHTQLMMLSITNASTYKKNIAKQQKSLKFRRHTQLSSYAQESLEIAGEAAFIATVSAVMFSITLVGLGLGFVLLRVESLVKKAKLLSKFNNQSAITF